MGRRLMAAARKMLVRRDGCQGAESFKRASQCGESRGVDAVVVGEEKVHAGVEGASRNLKNQARANALRPVLPDVAFGFEKPRRVARLGRRVLLRGLAVASRIGQ